MMANGHVANIDYTKQGNKLFLTHSEVPYILRGKGIGKELVEKTFSYIEANNMEAVAVCSFIKILALRSPKWKEIIK
jgi:predicted GNAT family acetyltransferase